MRQIPTAFSGEDDGVSCDRSPLSVIIGHSELVTVAEASDKEKIRSLETIAKSAQHLMQLVTDILDISSVEAKKLVINSRHTNIRGEIDAVINSLTDMARGKSLDLTCVIDQDIPSTVIVDPIRFRQILVNLISNAIKFTHRGSVHVNCRWLPKKAQTGTLKITVTDTGVGINAHQRRQLFQSFSRAHAEGEKLYGGSGLGLFLSRSLAKAMGGDVTLEASEPGQGSVFAMEILTQVSSCSNTDTVAEAIEILAPNLNNLSVLLVEDNELVQEVTKLILQQHQIAVTVANNGKEALDIIHNNPTGFDLVLMDMEMPVMDGYEATKTLIAKGFKPPIIALTAHATTTERERCLTAGCEDFIAKPVDQRSLLALLARVKSP